MDAKTLLSNVSVGYALTYLIGTVVVILLIRYVPRLLKLNLEAMARTYAKEKGLLGSRGGPETTADNLPLIRAYRMREESAGKTVEQRRAELGKAAIALRVRRGKELLEADPNLELREGDVISLVSSLAVHQWARDTLAVEDVLDPELLDFHIDALSIVTEAARSSVPAIGYAGSYTFANVLLTFGGTMMML